MSALSPSISLPSFETVFVNRDKGAYELAKRPVRPTMPSVLDKRVRDLSDSEVDVVLMSLLRWREQEADYERHNKIAQDRSQRVRKGIIEEVVRCMTQNPLVTSPPGAFFMPDGRARALLDGVLVSQEDESAEGLLSNLESFISQVQLVVQHYAEGIYDSISPMFGVVESSRILPTQNT